MLKRTILGAVALFATLALALPGYAQDYPTRPIRFIVPFAAGGGADIVARIVADRMREQLGQSVIVENRPGAGGNVGAQAVWASPADGYTLLFTTQGPLVVNKSLYSSLNYDPDKFVPVSLVASSQNVLAVNPKVQADSLQQLIAFAKAHPDRLNYASQGVGTTAHLAAELFKSMAGIKLVHVPYKGTGPALTDLLSGQVDMMFTEAAAAGQYIADGKLRALAVGSEKRSPSMPDVPAVSEVLPGFLVMTWYGLVAPAQTSPQIAAKLSAAVAKALADPVAAKRLVDLSVTAVGSTPAELAKFMGEERERWGKVIREAGAKVD
ncbi:MAG TPA: tripartite tricarboxylate transporter substrate binding protein [Xanthobacteraceae bacterium]|jgi:tripartite-type tricarboxylate transporter receptor subunit TctC|nr:tripartite tricarboxylate transporter substrate binding protein [Xanthobacteraceae bacterium]